MSEEVTYKTYDLRRRHVYEDTKNPGSNYDFLVGDRITVSDSVNRGDGHRDWRQRIRSVSSATSPLSGTRITCATSSGSSSAKYTLVNYGDWTYSVKGCFFPVDAPGGDPSTLLAEASNQALIRFLRQVKSSQRSVMGGVVLGELTEAIRMIRSPAQSLRRGVGAYLNRLQSRKRSFRKSSNRSKRKFLSETWLEYSFGWRPLVADIRDGAKALANIQHRHLVYSEYCSGSATVSGLEGSPFVYSNAHASIRWSATYRDVSTANAKYYGVTGVAPSSPGYAIAQLGLSWRDFLPTVWELIPYSFVVDYFTNIGEVIEAACTNTSSIRWANKGTSTEITRSSSGASVEADTYTGPLLSGGLQEQSLGTPTSWVKKSINRTAVDPSSLMPSLSFKLPGFSTQWINLAALARTHARLVPF